MRAAAFLRPAPDSGPAGAGAPHSLPAPQPRPGCGVPLAPGSGGPATLLACRGHGSSQHGLGMVKCQMPRRETQAVGRPWGSGLGGGVGEDLDSGFPANLASTFTTGDVHREVASSIRRLPVGPRTGASKSGPSLVHRRPVKGFVRQPNA